MRYGPWLALGAALALSACFANEPGKDSALEPVGQFVWEHDAGWFGGFSAVEVLEEGSRILAITDSARLVQAKLHRDGDRIARIEVTASSQLKGAGGLPLRNVQADAEGMARAADGTLFVSFEHVHVVRRFDTETAPATDLPRHPDFDLFRQNGSLEALALGPDGGLYTLPERPLSRRTGFPVYRYDGKVWQRAFTLTASSGFRAVSATFDEAGRFYVLERRVTILGFQTRLRRWVLNGGVPGDETVLLKTQPGQHGNLEGMSIWQDSDGRNRITLIADDNFWSILETEILEYAITD